MKQFVAGLPLNEADMAAIMAHCAADVASKEDRLGLLPAATGLRAVAAGDAKAWENAVTALLKAHEKEARQGELKRSFEAFICLPALMLAKLGMEKQMECKWENPYLPVSLLSEAPR